MYDLGTYLYPTTKIHNLQNYPCAIVLEKGSHVLGELFVAPNKGSIHIGEHSYVGVNTRIWSYDAIFIGDRVLIAHDVNIFDSNVHLVENPQARHEQTMAILNNGVHDHPELKSKKVTIEDDVWIACESIILKGVTIGKGAVVGAGSVVTKDVAPYTLVAGNPAKMIRHLDAPKERADS